MLNVLFDWGSAFFCCIENVLYQDSTVMYHIELEFCLLLDPDT